MRTKKGFTLIELIIVIAIMGILLAILIPSWSFYMQRARTRSQNSKAKVIFNAAQTIVTEMQMTERKVINDYDAGIGRSELIEQMYTHCPSGNPANPNPNEWYFYCDGSNGWRVNADGNAIGTGDTSVSGARMNYTSEYVNAANDSEWNRKLLREITKILDNNPTVYKIYVKDYKVQSVVSARFENDRFMGAFPVSLDKLEDLDVDVDAIRENRVIGAKMTNFDVDTSEF